jgi:putative PEP-CTERM system histidine kinase
MTNFSNPLMLWGYGLAALGYLVLSAFLLRQGLLWRAASGGAGRAAVAATALTALWAALSLLAVRSPALWLMSVVVDVGRYAAWYAFLVLLLQAGQGTFGAGSTRLHWMVMVSVVLPLGNWLVQGAAVSQASAGAGASASLLSGVFVGQVLMAVFGLLLVEQLYRNLPDSATWSAKPICLGLTGGFLFDLYLYSQAVLFDGVDTDALSVRGLVHAALVPLLLLSATRHRNWVSKIRVSHRTVFHSATLILVGTYLLFISGVGYYARYFNEDWGRALQVALVSGALLALLVVLFSRTLRAGLRVWLSKNFFRYRYDYRDEWLKFTRTLSSEGSAQDMGLRVIRGMADLLESPAGALWLRPSDDETVYRQVARWNWPRTLVAEQAESPFLGFMRETGWVVNLEEYRRMPERYRFLALPPWVVEQQQAWLIAPLWVDEMLLGFVELATPRTPMDVNWEVNDLLKTAGRQAASYLAQMQATESLLEARKFEAFSRMSAFVVHDLKNIVTQLSLMMKNAKRLSHNPEFQADMLMTVENSLERMRQLMLQLREGAAPAGKASGVELEPIAHVLADTAARRGRHLELDVEPRVATRGHTDRLERVLGHLVSNAFDATHPDRRVWLKVDRYGSHARVVVGDEGQGMAASFVQERLFKPFQSTKQAGMGIGAYESFQYVQELGGRVSVDSEEGRGTVITLLLPLTESFSESDLQQLGEA